MRLKNLISTAYQKFSIKYFSFFMLIYFGVPFSIADSSIALGNIEIKIKKVNKLTNGYSDLEKFKSLDEELEKFVQSQRLEGLSVGIVKDGKLVYTKGFGHANREMETTLQPYHLMRIGSVSKLITAVAIMKLIEDGKITLDSQVFGEKGILHGGIYDVITHKRYEEITIEHLLNHTAGWSKRTFGDPMFINERVVSSLSVPLPVGLDGIISFVLSNSLPYRPGTYYDYSNFGYSILGKVIEALTDMSYEGYVQSAILYPLGITSMQLAKSRMEDQVENEATYYDDTPNNLRLSCYGTGESVPSTYCGFDIEAMGAAGGWLATSADLLRFLTAVDGFKDTPDILSNQSLLAMTAPETGHPYGWRGISQGTWWRTGTLAGTSAILKRKDNGISWVAITNTSNRRSGSFNGRINWIMENYFAKVNDWPEQDLFALTYY